MGRKQIVILLSCFLACIGTLIALYAFSPLSKEIYRCSFTRKFIPGYTVQQDRTMDVDVNSFYLAGITSDKIYCGNYTAPFHLLAVNHTLTDSQHVLLRIRLDSVSEVRRFRLAVDSPYFYLTHGVVPEFLRGTIGEWEARRYLGDSLDYFAEAVPIGPSSIALRSLSKLQGSYELAKKSTFAPFTFQYSLLNKQLDGLFCLDGVLLKNRDFNELVYLHYYRNEFVVMDSNLTIRYRGHTIDTFSRARIKIAKIGDTGQSMLSAPPMQINLFACTHRKYLFIASNLLSANEDVQDYLTKTVIDQYDLTTGQYIHSFYVPQYDNERLSSFKVYGNQLIAIIGNHIVTYRLPEFVLNG